MARLVGPDLAYRAVFLPSGAPAAGRAGVVYANAAGTVLADILTYQPLTPSVPGAAIAGSVVTCDAYGLLPLWWFPDGVDTVWVTVQGGPLTAVGSSTDQRLDLLDTRVTAIESGGGGGGASTGYVDAGDATTAAGASAALAGHEADTTNVHGVANTALLETTSGAQGKADTAQAAAVASSAQRGANLADLASAATARTNLGLGAASTRAIGTTAGTVPDGADDRFTDARTPLAHAASHGTGSTDPITVAQTQVTGLGTALGARVPKGESYLSVVDYGAVGTADDTATLQAAIDAAATFGARVFLPVGTYVVAPVGTTRRMLRFTTGVRGIFGSGANTSIIKVKNGVGNYHSILTNFSSGTGEGAVADSIAGLELRDFTIDQNNTNNTTSDPLGTGAMLAGYPRFCIGVAGGSNSARVQVRNVRCVDTDGINTIFFQGRDIVIDSCELVVSATGSDHDHSAIYTSCISGAGGHCSITGNLIYATTTGNPTARTAIETHGGSQHVIGNTVRKYFKAGNLTGVSTTAGDGIQWIGNSFVGVRYGLDLWSLATSAYPPGLQGARISSNTFVMDPVSWTPTGATDCRAIFLDVSATDVPSGLTALPFRDIWIENNDIRYLPGHVGVSGDTINHAIDLRRTSAPTSGGLDRNIVIRNNFIDSPIASGIRYTSVTGDYVDGLIISGNRIRNPGQGSVAAGGGLSNGYANGIMIVGACKNSRIEDNDLVDDQTSHTMNVGMYLAPAYTGGAGNLVSGNRVLNAVTSELLFAAGIDGGYLVRHDMLTASWTAPTGNAASGSEIRHLATGTTYRQYASPEGQTWSSATPVPRRPGLAGQWTTVTNRPLIVPGTGTGTLAKDSWRYLPIRLDQDLPVDALTITTTVAATGGTAALIFGLFAADSTNRPGARQADYSTYGSIDLTVTAGVQQLATVGLTIPAGEWFLALAWTGTASGNPTVTTVTGFHPAVASATAVAAANAYLQSLSGGSVPSSATPSTTATAAPLIHCKLR